MKRIRLLVVMSLIAMGALAEPFKFDVALEDAKEFVVFCITNCIGSTIALMQERPDEFARPEDAFMPWTFDDDLGLSKRRCVVMLKGDVSLNGNKVCYLYDTPRNAHVLPRLMISAGGASYEGYFVDDKELPGNFVVLEGRKKWMYHPPYDPFLSYKDEFVQLMLLTPEHSLDKKRIKLGKCRYGKEMVEDAIGKDFMRNSPEELMAKLKVERVFSNRVFRMNEGCAFQVDYPAPDMDWRKSGSKAKHLDELKRAQAANSILMHLSADEVSEIVYLAYMADGGDMKGYEDACARCPELLKPVTEFKTGIGSRLHQAMKKGGMIKP